MTKYYIHTKLKTLALKITDNNFSEIKFNLEDGTYSITTSEGEYTKESTYYTEISREDLISTIQSKTLDYLMEQNLKLEENLLENKRRILNLSRNEYNNI